MSGGRGRSGGRRAAAAAAAGAYALHGVVDGHARGDGPAGRVDVDGDVLVGILVGQIQELRHEDVGDLVVHLLPEQQDAVPQQARHHVHLPVARVHHRHPHRVRRRLLEGEAVRAAVGAAAAQLRGRRGERGGTRPRDPRSGGRRSVRTWSGSRLRGSTSGVGSDMDDVDGVHRESGLKARREAVERTRKPDGAKPHAAPTTLATASVRSMVG